jgi:hypothetical protein
LAAQGYTAVTSERATAAVLASIFGGLLACFGAWLGVTRILVEAYRSCPSDAAETANATMATGLGVGALALFTFASIASLWGLVQGLRKRTPRPGLIALALGVISAGLGFAASLVPHTMAC